MLRNAIYAKHGHIFESEELTGYFSRFDWYKPAKTVTYADLSETERENIEVIQKFEKMDENSETIVWGPEKEGIWQDIFVMAAGWSDRFIIYTDNRNPYEANSNFAKYSAYLPNAVFALHNYGNYTNKMI